MNEESFWKRVEELESMDESVKVKHLHRRDWPEHMIKNKNLFWQVPRSTAELIHALTLEKNPKLILELGTSAGYSTIWFSHGAPEATIHTIEFSEYRIDIAKETFKKTQADNIILHEGKIEEIIKDWKEKIDLLFIDANKESYFSNFKTLEPFLNDKALVIADNILDNPPKVQDFVDYMKENSDFSSTVMDIDNGLLLAIKK